jgi:hypothetical protein
MGDEVLRHRVAETGGAAGDDRLDLIELHGVIPGNWFRKADMVPDWRMRLQAECKACHDSRFMRRWGGFSHVGAGPSRRMDSSGRVWPFHPTQGCIA